MLLSLIFLEFKSKKEACDTEGNTNTSEKCYFTVIGIVF